MLTDEEFEKELVITQTSKCVRHAILTATTRKTTLTARGVLTPIFSPVRIAKMDNHIVYVLAIGDLTETRYRVQAGRPLDKSRTRAYIERVRKYLDLLEQEL